MKRLALVSDLFAPLSGEVAETNAALASAPELVNQDPYGEGWMLRVRVASRTSPPTARRAWST